MQKLAGENIGNKAKWSERPRKRSHLPKVVDDICVINYVCKNFTISSQALFCLNLKSVPFSRRGKWTYYSSFSISFSVKDRDKPITYQYHYKTENGLYTVISYGSEGLVRTVLPPGKKQDNYKIYFEVMVSDSFSAANTTLLKIEVNALIFWKICFLVRHRQRRTD